MLQDLARLAHRQQPAVNHAMLQHQATVAQEIDRHHLDDRIGIGHVISLRQAAADVAVAALVVDGFHQQGRAFRIVLDGEEPQVAHEARREILRDETVVAIIRPDIAQRAHGVAAACDVGRPDAVLGGGLHADALDVLHHGEA